MLTNKLIDRFEQAIHAVALDHGNAKVVAKYKQAKTALQAEIERVRRPSWLPNYTYTLSTKPGKWREVKQ